MIAIAIAFVMGALVGANAALGWANWELRRKRSRRVAGEYFP